MTRATDTPATLAPIRWWDDPHELLAFADAMVEAGLMAASYDTLHRLIEKPWHWDYEHAVWVALERPDDHSQPGPPVGTALEGWHALCAGRYRGLACWQCREPLTDTLGLGAGSSWLRTVRPDQPLTVGHTQCLERAGWATVSAYDDSLDQDLENGVTNGHI